MEKITRSEFDSITRFLELIEWGRRCDYEYFSEIFYEDEIDDLIDEWTAENADGMRWFELVDELESVAVQLDKSETGYYFQESALDYRPILEDEFLGLKEDFLDYLLRNGLLIDDTDNEDEEFETDIALEDMLKEA